MFFLSTSHRNSNTFWNAGLCPDWGESTERLSENAKTLSTLGQFALCEPLWSLRTETKNMLLLRGGQQHQLLVLLLLLSSSPPSFFS
jgi:hypothetical protein